MKAEEKFVMADRDTLLRDLDSLAGATLRSYGMPKKDREAFDRLRAHLEAQADMEERLRECERAYEGATLDSDERAEKWMAAEEKLRAAREALDGIARFCEAQPPIELEPMREVRVAARAALSAGSPGQPTSEARRPDHDFSASRQKQMWDEANP